VGYYLNDEWLSYRTGYSSFGVTQYYTAQRFKNLLSTRFNDVKVGYYGYKANPLNSNTIYCPTIGTILNQSNYYALNQNSMAFSLNMFANSSEGFCLINGASKTTGSALVNAGVDIGIDGYTVKIERDGTTIAVKFIAKPIEVTYDVNRPANAYEGDELIVSDGKGLEYDYTPIPLTITYHYDEPTYQNNYVTLANYIGYLNAKLTGFDFIGWSLLDFLVSSGENEQASDYWITLNQPIGIDGNNLLPRYYSALTAKAIWQVKTFSVIIDLNDVNSENGSSEVSLFGGSVSRSGNSLILFYEYNTPIFRNGKLREGSSGTGSYTIELERFGYTLGGLSKVKWSGSQIVSGAASIDHAISSSDTFIYTNSPTLYAYWIPKQYSLEFKLDESKLGSLYYESFDALFNQTDATSNTLTLGDRTFTLSADRLIATLDGKVYFDMPIGVTPTQNWFGYDFKEWGSYLCDTAVDQNSNLIEEYISGEKAVFYAVWEIQNVKIVFVTSPNSGIDDYKNSTYYRYYLRALAADENLTGVVTDLTWIDKDCDGANNGVTQPISTSRTNKINDPYDVANIAYHVGIPYLSAALSRSISAPSAAGYTFLGYYYYDEANDVFVKYFDDDGNLVAKWDIYWDNTSPIVLYAAWEIKTFTITVEIPHYYDDLFNSGTLGLQESLIYNYWTGTTTMPLKSSLGVTCLTYDANGNRLESDTFGESNPIGTQRYELKFYERFEIKLTIPEGHFIESVCGSDTIFHQTSDGFIVEDITTSTYYLGEKDAFVLNFNEYSLDSAKQDANGYIENVVGNIDISFLFDRQFFNVKLHAMMNNGIRLVEDLSKLEEYTLPYAFDFEETFNDFIDGMLFYEVDPTLYSNASCTTPIDNDNVFFINLPRDIYIKFTENLTLETHEAVFYEYKNGGYIPINTGLNYVVALKLGNNVYNNSLYRWSTDISGARITNLPIATAFYRPEANSVFCCWINLEDNEVNSINGVITMDKLLKLLGNDGLKSRLVTIGTPITADMKIYAVYESTDKIVSASMALENKLGDAVNDASEIMREDYVYYDSNGDAYSNLVITFNGDFGYTNRVFKANGVDISAFLEHIDNSISDSISNLKLVIPVKELMNIIDERSTSVTITYTFTSSYVVGSLRSQFGYFNIDIASLTHSASSGDNGFVILKTDLGNPSISSYGYALSNFINPNYYADNALYYAVKDANKGLSENYCYLDIGLSFTLNLAGAIVDGNAWYVLSQSFSNINLPYLISQGSSALTIDGVTFICEDQPNNNGIVINKIVYNGETLFEDDEFGVVSYKTETVTLAEIPLNPADLSAGYKTVTFTKTTFEFGWSERMR